MATFSTALEAVRSKKVKKAEDSSILVWSNQRWYPVLGRETIIAEHKKRGMPLNLQALGNDQVRVFDGWLNKPEQWRTPRILYIYPDDDLFHNDIPDEYIHKVMEVIRRTPRHTYKICTRSAERMADFFATHDVPDNLWLGVAVDVAGSEARIDYLRKIPATVKFISEELPPVGVESMGGFTTEGVDWMLFSNGLTVKVS